MPIPGLKLRYDPECEKLARHFLDDSDVSQAEINLDAPVLAQEIQDTIESFLRQTRRRGDSD